MALNLLFLTSLVLAYLPLSWSYRNGARSESCYNMLVMHERNVFGTITVVDPVDCGSSCPYQLSMVGRVAGEDNLTVEESNPTTYQCGEVYYLQLASTGNQSATIDGIMVEARENTSSFEEGSTIWGTWVNDPNSFYHAVECNRSSTSSEGPFPNAATQNEPQDVTSIDLYWKAPLPPNTTAEYQQLPLEIKFWFVVVQRRLIYYYPVAGPVLARDCTEPEMPPTAETTPSALRYEAVAVSPGDGQGCPPEDVLNAIRANISQDIRELLQNNILPSL